ncbi:MAG TPA: hypothetical protein VFJ24_11895 [Gaiellales bacterium]|nr:hypothetical protein [Gaiellales bacterium]
MANRQYYKDWGTKLPGLVTLFIDFATTTNGAVGTIVSQSGIKSIVRQSAGRYLITLSDSYNNLKGADALVLVAHTNPYTAARAANAFIIRNASVSTISAPTFIVQFLNNSNADTDVEDAASVSINVTVSNSSIKA